MRLSHSMILACALFAATPAMAQDNTAAPDNTVAANAIDANAVSTTTVNETTSSTTTAPEAGLPPDNAVIADNAATPAPAPRRSFPWGVLGLLGLIGLFGVRKVKA